MLRAAIARQSYNTTTNVSPAPNDLINNGVLVAIKQEDLSDSMNPKPPSLLWKPFSSFSEHPAAPASPNQDHYNTKGYNTFKLKDTPFIPSREHKNNFVASQCNYFQPCSPAYSNAAPTPVPSHINVHHNLSFSANLEPQNLPLQAGYSGDSETDNTQQGNSSNMDFDDADSSFSFSSELSISTNKSNDSGFAPNDEFIDDGSMDCDDGIGANDNKWNQLIDRIA